MILTPDTLLRWHRQGRPHLSADLVALIQRIASENPRWGAERIRGELLKLGFQVANDAVQTYLRRVRPPRSPFQDWNTFIKNHTQDIWACDFLPVVDLYLRPLFLYFIIELSSRRVVHFGVTRHPMEAWAAQQLREATPYGARPKYLIRDHDRKFGASLDQVAKTTGIEVLKIPFRVPRANAICETFLGSVCRECLDRRLIVSERQLYRVIKEYAEYFNRARPHQGLEQVISEGAESELEVVAAGNIIPFPGRTVRRDDRGTRERGSPKGSLQPTNGKIIGFPVLGGLHHHYRRVA